MRFLIKKKKKKEEEEKISFSPYARSPILFFKITFIHYNLELPHTSITKIPKDVMRFYKI